jgi:hypothetical protein
VSARCEHGVEPPALATPQGTLAKEVGLQHHEKRKARLITSSCSVRASAARSVLVELPLIPVVKSCCVRAVIKARGSSASECGGEFASSSWESMNKQAAVEDKQKEKW